MNFAKFPCCTLPASPRPRSTKPFSFIQPTHPLSDLPSAVIPYSYPRGVVFIIGAWNYPFQLVLLPLIGAIAAGNCIVVKPSEVSESATQWLMQFVAPVLDSKRIAFVEGGPQETTVLLKQKWDFIFYTGNATVGRLVSTAAANFLTPVALELGGKCPAIFDDLTTSSPTSGTGSASYTTISSAGSNDSSSSTSSSSSSDHFSKTAIRRLLMGKFLNVGQTCVAPDYCIIPAAFEAKFVELVKDTLLEFFGQDPRQSQHLARIVNRRHFGRLKSLVSSLGPSDKIVVGGSMEEADLWIEPTLIRMGSDVSTILHTKDSPNKVSDSTAALAPLLTEEIFGPILPYVVYDRVSDLAPVVQLISHEPLALYIFSRNRGFSRSIINSTRSGSVSVNEAVSQASFRDLPFGGVGSSGSGQYYGKRTFDLFSHSRPILQRDLVPDAPLRYPPYSDQSLSVISHLQPYSLPASVTPAISSSTRRLHDLIRKKAKL